jgi:hypothetical protein
LIEGQFSAVANSGSSVTCCGGGSRTVGGIPAGGGRPVRGWGLCRRGHRWPLVRQVPLPCAVRRGVREVPLPWAARRGVRAGSGGFGGPVPAAVRALPPALWGLSLVPPSVGAEPPGRSWINHRHPLGASEPVVPAEGQAGGRHRFRVRPRTVHGVGWWRHYPRAPGVARRPHRRRPVVPAGPFHHSLMPPPLALGHDYRGPRQVCSRCSC